MLLIHLVLQLWLISVNLSVSTLAYASENRIIHDPAARRRVPHCVLARRSYARSRGAARRDAILHARGAQRRNKIFEHASPVLGSVLGKIGQVSDSGIVTPRRGRGRQGARGAGR